jgi:hypothetical protein
MNCVCTCGFDYADFIAHHQIPGGSKFNCPGCDMELQAVSTPPVAESSPLRAEPTSDSRTAQAG